MADVDTNIYDWSTTEANNKPTGATTIATGLDDNLRRIQATVRTEYDKTVPAINPGGRLTLTTALAVTTADVTAATTLYYTPYKSDKVVLFDGTNWKQYTFTERSIAVPATTVTMYDAFLYDNAGTLTLELTAWTDDTTRATALTTQNGVLVKTGATTRRYLGSFRTTGVSGQTEDSLAKRYVWNYYNRVVRPMRVLEATDSWTYSTASWRQANNSATNQLDFVRGVGEDAVVAHVHAIVDSSTTTIRTVWSGIGLDATNAYATGCLPTRHAADNTASRSMVPSRYSGLPGIGRHFLAWLEHGGGTDTQTWYGDLGAATQNQAGIEGEMLA